MSEPTSDPGATPAAPIQVSATPARAQIEAGIRQAGGAIGIILAAFGMTAWAHKIGVVVALAPQFAILLTILGPVIWGAFVWVGQLATRKQAKNLAITAAAAPDSVAQVRTP